MHSDFRREDRQNLTRYCAALQAAVFAARPAMSVSQVAGAVTRGTDDPQGVSEKTLYAAIEGNRKFPPHKLARLAAVTGSTAVIQELARQHGGVFYALPPGRAADMAGLRGVLRRVSRFADDVCAARAPDGDGGEAVMAAEYPALEEDCRLLISAALGLLEECKAARR